MISPFESAIGIADAPERSGDSAESATWHMLPIAEAIRTLQADGERGLSQSEVTRRLSQAQERSVLSILLAQFNNLIVALLVAVTAIAFSMGENVEAVAILVVIVLNAAIGYFTEWKAQQALSALQKQAVRVTHVIRDGVESEIPAADLVPGDVVVLAAGARVPADGRIIECARLQIEESALTGESLAVTKTTEMLNDEEASLGDRLNMAFLGTTITDGRGQLLATAIGSQTEVGKIGILIDEAVKRTTPLEQKLARLGHMLIVIVMGLCAIIVRVGWLRGIADLWHMLEIGLSLAIAAVPEGLPAATTMTLALGMQRMARMRALVRQLPAVETLGAVTVICTDITGTLSRTIAQARGKIAEAMSDLLAGSDSGTITFRLKPTKIRIASQGFAAWPVLSLEPARRAVRLRAWRIAKIRSNQVMIPRPEAQTPRIRKSGRK